MSIRLGNAPCSWGTIEGFESAPIPYAQMLDELVEAGFVGTELGDYGFMPTDVGALRAALLRRGLVMLGAFEGVALRHPHAVLDAWPRMERIARLLAGVADLDARRPVLVLADKNGDEADRAGAAGRVTPDIALPTEARAVFARNVEEIARRVLDVSGLKTVFHHHCAGYVETSEEVDDLLERTDPKLVSLVFDTGHYTYGSGQADGPGATSIALDGLRSLWPRVSYLHFKDCDPAVAARARASEWDYTTAVRHGIFCELGQGCVDFAGLVAFLKAHDYDDWITVEQDVLPGLGEPLESARRNRAALRELGL